MLPVILRVEMIAIALVFLVVVVRAVNRKKLWLQYSILWILIAASLVVLALFPQLVSWISGLLGIITPSNFIYLIALIALSLITFSLTVIVSKQSQKIKTLIQMVSIEKFMEEEMLRDRKTTISQESQPPAP